MELPVPDESIIEKFHAPGQLQRAGIVVSIYVQDRLKTVPGLSAGNGDNSRFWDVENIGKTEKSTTF